MCPISESAFESLTRQVLDLAVPHSVLPGAGALHLERLVHHEGAQSVRLLHLRRVVPVEHDQRVEVPVPLHTEESDSGGDIGGSRDSSSGTEQRNAAARTRIKNVKRSVRWSLVRVSLRGSFSSRHACAHRRISPSRRDLTNSQQQHRQPRALSSHRQWHEKVGRKTMKVDKKKGISLESQIFFFIHTQNGYAMA